MKRRLADVPNGWRIAGNRRRWSASKSFIPIDRQMITDAILRMTYSPAEVADMVFPA